MAGRDRPFLTRCADAPTTAGHCCRPAVQRTYRELCERGQPERFAFEAAVTVYLWHHPEVAAPQALDTVSQWLWNGVSH
jgi:hypothetical protein